MATYSEKACDEIAEKIIYLVDSFPEVHLDAFAEIFSIPLHSLSHLRKPPGRYTHVPDRVYDILKYCADNFVIQNSYTFVDQRNSKNPKTYDSRKLRQVKKVMRGKKKNKPDPTSKDGIKTFPAATDLKEEKPPVKVKEEVYKNPETLIPEYIPAFSANQEWAKRLSEIDDQIRRIVKEEIELNNSEIRKIVAETIKDTKIQFPPLNLII